MIRRFAVFTIIVVILCYICGCEPKKEAVLSEVLPANIPMIEAPVEQAIELNTPVADVPVEQATELNTPVADVPVEQATVVDIPAPNEIAVEIYAVPEDINIAFATAVKEANKPQPAELAPAEVVKAEPETEKPKPVDVIRPEPKKEVTFHDNCAGIFKKYVSDQGKVNYRQLGLKREKLRTVLGSFSGLDVKKYKSWSEKDKIAFWINAYNLSTLKVIVDNYPIEPSPFKTILYPANSIKQISDPWNKYGFPVMGVQYTLREIERNILLKEFDDIRVCFALTYASFGSPRLLNEPYTGEKLDKQLDRQINDFLTSPNGFKIDKQQKRIYLSVIFKEWYADSFIRKYGTDKKYRDKSPAVRAALNFISNYVSREDADWLARKDYSVEFLKYDWTLNE